MKRWIAFSTILVLYTTLCLAQTERTHTLMRGETLESVAKKYGISLEELKKANPGAEKVHYVGMRLIIPQLQASTQEKTEASQNEDYETNTNIEYSALYEKNSLKKLDPFDFTHFALFYTAPFKAIDYGIVGFIGNLFGIGGTGFGGTFSGGWQFKGISSGGGCAKFGLGPNYCYPISEHVFIYVPICADLYYYTKGIDNSSFSFGLEMLPSIGFKYGKFNFSGGFFLGWVQGSSSITPGLNVSVGYDF